MRLAAAWCAAPDGAAAAPPDLTTPLSSPGIAPTPCFGPRRVSVAPPHFPQAGAVPARRRQSSKAPATQHPVANRLSVYDTRGTLVAQEARAVAERPSPGTGGGEAAAAPLPPLPARAAAHALAAGRRPGTAPAPDGPERTFGGAWLAMLRQTESGIERRAAVRYVPAATSMRSRLLLTIGQPRAPRKRAPQAPRPPPAPLPPGVMSRAQRRAARAEAAARRRREVWLRRSREHQGFAAVPPRQVAAGSVRTALQTLPADPSPELPLARSPSAGELSPPRSPRGRALRRRRTELAAAGAERDHVLAALGGSLLVSLVPSKIAAAEAENWAAFQEELQTFVANAVGCQS
eukprot:TRINITY_DN15923_c0_g1_i2.p1 TRINITY_DN15923_c0_g1~~TRINITY_DN15923_c0_g1_i2.p1  ORF type:complete len:348 (+),score=53.89 TRINITY_DN15923_c0_g1_i2:92-1135(+)